jgi:hypothetical protein
MIRSWSLFWGPTKILSGNSATHLGRDDASMRPYGRAHAPTLNTDSCAEIAFPSTGRPMFPCQPNENTMAAACDDSTAVDTVFLASRLLNVGPILVASIIPSVQSRLF